MPIPAELSVLGPMPLRGRVRVPGDKGISHRTLLFAAMAEGRVTFYSAPSGAGVFASGTNWWISKLNPPGPGNPHEPMIIAMTMNVLRAFGLGPAGTAHPTTGNWHQLPGFSRSRNRSTTSTTADNT